MAIPKAKVPPPKRFGFPVYRNGVRIRELVVVAGNAVIAEVKASRQLQDGEWLWYATPRLLHESEQADVE